MATREEKRGAYERGRRKRFLRFKFNPKSFIHQNGVSELNITPMPTAPMSDVKTPWIKRLKAILRI